MSFNNDGFNTTSNTTGRNEGFQDSTRATDTYGSGTGSGAYDSSNTGLGGFGQERQSDMGTTGAGALGGSDLNRGTDFDNNNNLGSTGRREFDNDNLGSTGRRDLNDDISGSGRNFDNDNSLSSGTGTGATGTGGAFGRDRGLEKPGFSGTDSQFGNTETGGTFNRSDDLNTGSRGLDNVDDRENRDRLDTSRNDQFGGETTHEREGGKPSFGDKMRGTAEKLAGSVTNNQGLKERGIERKQGEL